MIWQLGKQIHLIGEGCQKEKLFPETYRYTKLYLLCHKSAGWHYFDRQGPKEEVW